jgi:hypothetical protein
MMDGLEEMKVVARVEADNETTMTMMLTMII